MTNQELKEVLSYIIADVNVSRETYKILHSFGDYMYIKNVKVYGFTKTNVYYSYNNILGKSKIHNFAELFVNRKYYKNFLNLIYGKGV